MPTAIKFENISKQYRLGLVSTRTLSHDLNRWFKTSIMGKEDPYLKIGEVNDRAQKGTSDYVWALKDIDFEVQQGEVLGIIGKNGAGKSTLLKILSKVTAPTTGTIKAAGRIASLLEVGTGFHPEMTGRENIYMNGAIMGMSKTEITRKLDEIVDFSGVERYLDTPAKRYSSGMTVRLGFAIAAHLEPEILVVDEVLAVGDFDFQKKAIGKMKSVSSQEGRTVLFVSHNLPSVRNLCNKGLLLHNGMIDKMGDVNEIIDLYSEKFVSFNAKKQITIDDSFRYLKYNRSIEFLEVILNTDQNNNAFATNEDINLKLVIKGNENVTNFRFAVGVFNIRETCIGVYFSDQVFSIGKNEIKTINFTLKDTQLAKGQYYLDFSIGKGNEVSGIKDFDLIQKTIFFEVAFKDIRKEEMISVWMETWGNINFGNVQINNYL
ncbi:MAG: ABC transporter ATP-binding protein [Paludibacter sp.]